MSYAEGTEVSEEKSKAEIDKMLRSGGATSTALGEGEGAGVVVFALGGFHVRFRCPLPNSTHAVQALSAQRRFKYNDPPAGVIQRWIELERRRRWRALGLTIKAKLVSVESGIERFEEAFLAHIVIAGGVTVGQKVLPEVASIYKTGQVPNGGLLGSGL